MSLKAIIIESSSDYRSLVLHHLTTRWPNARVTEYDPELSGILPDSFAGAGNDLVILGERLGEQSGLDWMRRFATVAGRTEARHMSIQPKKYGCNDENWSRL